LREVDVATAGVEGSGAKWGSLEIEADSIDLAARAARLAAIRWVDPRIVFEPGDPAPLPILRSVVRDAVVPSVAAPEPQPSGAPAGGAPKPASPAAPVTTSVAADADESDDAAGWRWSAATVDVERMRIAIRGA